MHGKKIHGFDGDHYPTETTCGLLIQPGDEVLPYERRVTCQKCLRILNRVGA